ncbi:hypothetical protein J437_LFUL018095, partial [Ladona fulva]
MSRDRLLLILQALHFSENPKDDETVPTDRLYKIRPFLNIFEETMSEIYSPKRELCLDESMILWRGKLLFKQYLKGKHHKYGIEVYMLPASSGIVIQQIVYTGAGDLIKKTITYCRDCVDEPGLCMEPCFLMYHGRDP